VDVTPESLVGLLAEPLRLRVFAAVVLGAPDPAAIARATGDRPRDVATALHRLSAAGLLTDADGTLVAQIGAFKEAVREAPRAPSPALDPDRTRAAVLRAFVVDGRLVSIPAAHGKRRVVLEHIAASFTPGLKYPEREVDAVLRAWYADHASLRRYLVDEGLLARDAGGYWRIGGPVDLG
jgi:hypothetical protein